MRDDRYAVAVAYAFSRITGNSRIGVCTFQGGVNAAGMQPPSMCQAARPISSSSAASTRSMASELDAARSETMPKLIPVPDALSKPFWDAVNERRLVLQHCTACDRLQYPPQQACQVCRSAAGLTWKEVEGKGHIASYIVIEDGRLNRRMPDQPYNMAMVTLDADKRVNFYSNLPGTPPYKVPVGAAVEVTFEEVAPDQLIHEWRVVPGSPEDRGLVKP
jgi:uncharacterized OB-fold protein